MRYLKDIILEKLKITNNTGVLPNIEDFKTTLYNFNGGHVIMFDKYLDPKYKDLKNFPEYENDGKLYYTVALFVSKRMNNEQNLYAECSIDDFVPIKRFTINSMDHLVEVLGEELVLKIWDYIR